MTRRAVRLGDLVFASPLWVAEWFAPDSATATVELSAQGSHIVYERRVTTPYRTLESRKGGWITEAQAERLREIWLDQTTESWEIEYDDGTVETVRPARERKVKIDPIYEGAVDYLTTFPLAAIA